MKKYFTIILILGTLAGFSLSLENAAASVANPNEPCNDSKNPTNLPCMYGSTEAGSRYHLLAPIDVEGGIVEFDPGQKNAIGSYLNLMIKILIGLAAVMSVVMIVIGGIEYMTSELVHNKEAARSRMTNAVFGLVITLGAYALLYTINPDLLKTDVELKEATIAITPTTNSVIIKSSSANCSVAASGPCTPTNLSSAFGSDASDASRICTVESGGNPAMSSGGDRCAGGTQFSIGLFQINLIANGSRVRTAQGQSCENLFEREDGSAISGSNYINPPGSSRAYNCKAKTDQASANRLSACVVTLMNPQENIKIAAQLNSQRPNFQDWRYSDRAACGDEMFQ